MQLHVSRDVGTLILFHLFIFSMCFAKSMCITIYGLQLNVKIKTTFEMPKFSRSNLPCFEIFVLSILKFPKHFHLFLLLQVSCESYKTPACCPTLCCMAMRRIGHSFELSLLLTTLTAQLRERRRNNPRTRSFSLSFSWTPCRAGPKLL